MDIEQILTRLAIALGIGLLFGLERGWKTRAATPGTRAAGIRTFAISGLLGGMVSALAQATGNPVSAGLVLGFGFAVFAGVITVFERDAERAAGSYSATTIIAALLTFVLGAYALVGDMRVAAAVAVGATGILAAREDIHRWVARITWPELRSALVLLAMTFVILPVVPDTAIGPYGGVNPREVWVIAIVLAAVSFLGYGTVRMFGAERGVLLASLAGGLVSSTAVTLTSARRTAAGEGEPHLLAAGVAVATAVSFVRVIAIVAVIKPPLLSLLAPVLAVAILAAVLYALIALYRFQVVDAGAGPPANFTNPFSLWPVIGFAVFLGIIILLGRMVGETFGARGALIGAAAVGLADVDSITVSMARLVPQPLDTLGAGSAILAAVASNMLSKLAIAAAIGRRAFAMQTAIMTVTCWLAALVALWATLLVSSG